MPRGNVNNLRTPTSEEAREIGRKGGLKSAESRRAHKLFRDILRDIMVTDLSDEDEARKALETLGLQPTMENALMLAASQKAKQGDVEALRFLRDTLGEKPTESFNLGIQGKPIQSLDLSKLTDSELEALADGCQ